MLSRRHGGQGRLQVLVACGRRRQSHVHRPSVDRVVLAVVDIANPRTTLHLSAQILILVAVQDPTLPEVLPSSSMVRPGQLLPGSPISLPSQSESRSAHVFTGPYLGRRTASPP